MKRFIQWLRRHPQQQSIASEADQRDVGAKVKPELKAEGDYSDDSSFNWEGIDRIENFNPGKTTQIQDRRDCEDIVLHTTRESADDPLSGAEENIGVDPYNTARFDTENK